MRVLVVEDSLLDRTTLRAMVEHLGHACDEATDGADAWGRLNRDQYDAVLTDWMMPSMSGPELCRRIRERDGAPYVFTVVCTASNDRARGLEAVRAGADLFLTKPVDLISLEMCLITAARVVAAQRQLAQQNDQLRTRNSALAEDAYTDHLTGLANRRRLDEDLQRIAGLASRYGVNACIALCDVDRFKPFNDRFGHPAGDMILARIGALLRSSSRESDSVYRYGGEELLVLLPGQTPVSASVAVERIRLAVEAAGIPHPDNRPYGVVTISIGVAGLPAGAHVNLQSLLAKADEALYEAKRSGRNRVVVHPGTLHRLGEAVGEWGVPEPTTI
jgi:two-component system, cell cycle response regulator